MERTCLQRHLAILSRSNPVNTLSSFVRLNLLKKCDSDYDDCSHYLIMSNLLKLSRFMRYGLVNLSRSNATVAHEVSSTTDSAQVDQCKYDEWAAFLPGVSNN